MRRSNSFSHIPLPTFKMERSKSSSRISRPSNCPKTPNNLPSSSAQIAGGSSSASLTINRLSNLRQTPLSRPSSVSSLGNRLSNLRRTPSIGATPQSCRGKSPSTAGHIPEQYSKIRRYLIEILNCDKKIMDNLKPATISNFIQVFKMLLAEMEIHIEINTTNYKEVVIDVLKSIFYPGTISISVLKTVNTMHSWPYVVNIFAWLIDLIIDYKTSIETVQENSQGMSKITMENIAVRFDLFNRSEYQENVESLNQQLTENLNNFFNLDMNEINELANSVRMLHENNANFSQKIQEYTENISKLHNESQQVKAELQVLYNENDLIVANINIEDQIKIVEDRIEQMKHTIDNQPYSMEQIKQLKDEIDQLEHRKSLKEEKCQHLLKILDEYDCQMVNLKKKIETKIYNFNSMLATYRIEYPKCDRLMLDENAINTPDFIHQIEKCLENQEAISIELKENIKKLTSDLEGIESEINEEQSICHQISNELEQLHEKRIKIFEEISILDTRFESEKQNYLTKKKELEDLMVEMIDNESIDDLKDKVEKLQKQKLQMQISLDEECANTLRRFKKNHEDLLHLATICVKIHNNIAVKLTETHSQIEKVENEMVADLKKLEIFQQVK